MDRIRFVCVCMDAGDLLRSIIVFAAHVVLYILIRTMQNSVQFRAAIWIWVFNQIRCGRLLLIKKIIFCLFDKECY